MPGDKPSLADVSARLDRLETLLERLSPVSDPAPDDWGRFRWPGLGGWRIPVPPRPGDPSPIDLNRLTKVQLQLATHEIAAERVRLDAMEGLIKEQIAALEKG